MTRNILLSLSLGLIFVGCGSKDDTASFDECEVADDCIMHISVWDPTCDEESDNLLTPAGSGLSECVEGQCVTDFEIVETDCSENGQVCQNDEAGIGSCVDPS